MRVVSERVFGGAVAAVVGLLVLVPIGFLIVASFSSGTIGEVGNFTLAHYSKVLGDGSYWRVVLNTIWVSGLAVTIALMLGVPLAWLLTRADVAGQRFWRALAPAPMYLSPLVTAVVWDRLLTSREGYLVKLTGGLIGGWDPHGPLGIAVLMGLYFSTYVYLYSAPAFANLDARAEQAARVCGAPLRSVLWKVTRPLVTPSLVSVSTLVLVFAMGLFSIPAVLGWPVDYTLLPLKIYFLLSVPPVEYGAALVMSVITLALTSALLVFYYRRIGSRGAQLATVTGSAAKTQIPLGRGRPLALGYLVGCFLLTLVVPIAIAGWMLVTDVTGRFVGLAGVRRVLELPDLGRTLVNTLVVAVLASILLVMLGGAIAYVLRFKVLGRYGRIVDFVATYPTAVPGVVLSAGLMWSYLKVPWGPLVYGTLGIMVLACVTQFMAVTVRSTVAGTSQLSDEMFAAASVAGASWGVRLRRIFVPTLGRHMWGVWLLAMLLSLRELSAVLLLWDSDIQTLPILTFSQWREGDYAGLAGIGLLELLLAVVIVAGARGAGALLKLRRR